MSNRDPDSRNFSSIAHAPQMPDKFAELKPEPDRKGAHNGQVLILFAAFIVGLMGMLGLATDVGYALAARRTVQGAADAGAMAGARQIARWKSSAPTSALGDTTAVVNSNKFNNVNPTLYYCKYIGNDWSEVGDCGSTVPSNAAGVRVRTKLKVNTFFIRAVPLAPKTVTVVGYAKARVMRAQAKAPDSPFIICGFGAWDVTGNSTTQNGGGPFDILSSESPMKINPAAVGKTFRIHDQLHKMPTSKCGIGNSSWKGLNPQDQNVGKTTPGWFKWDTGTQAGPTRDKVNGADGCNANTGMPYNCVMLVPIASNKTHTTTGSDIWVVGYAAFRITEIDKNSHNALLLDDYIVAGPGTSDWCQDCGGATVIRLIW